MFFVGGIHGVGKTFFCDQIKNKIGINCYSSSQLIAIGKQQTFSENKLVSDIDINQLYLINAINELKKSEKEFILDGHFCLLNQNGRITRISEDTFELLSPRLIIVLTEKAEIVHDRRLMRDGIDQSILEIEKFQAAEVLYSKEISEKYNIPLEICNGSQDITRIIDLISKGGY